MIRFGAGLGEELIPIVRGLPAFQHLAEDPISIIAAFVSAPGALVIDPSVKDYFGRRVIPKKQSVLLEKLGTKPVFVVFPKSYASSVSAGRERSLAYLLKFSSILYNIYSSYKEAVAMNFNIYLDDETGQQLNHAAKREGESRNALVRQAVSQWLSRHGKSQWPNEVLAFKGVADMPLFEASRGKFKPPDADPLA